VLYYNLLGQPSYMRSVVDRNVVMRRIPILQNFSVLYKVFVTGKTWDLETGREICSFKYWLLKKTHDAWIPLYRRTL